MVRWDDVAVPADQLTEVSSCYWEPVSPRTEVVTVTRGRCVLTDPLQAARWVLLVLTVTVTVTVTVLVLLVLAAAAVVLPVVVAV